MRALCFGVVFSALAASAAQVVVTEVTYTHSATTTSDSHYLLAPLPGTPTDWVSPINYAQGTAVVRLEVFTKPTTAATRFQICFEGSPSYACTNQAPAYTTPGVYTWTTPFPSFYQYSQVNWSLGARRIALILKDTNNVKPAPENVGATESARYMPTDLRVTVTLVSPGGTYEPPDAGVDAGVDAGTPFDAGVPDAGAADAGSPDAGLDAPDAGQADAGAEDAGPGEVPDAGGLGEPGVQGGCGCDAAPALLSLLALALVRRRRGGA